MPDHRQYRDRHRVQRAGAGGCQHLGSAQKDVNEHRQDHQGPGGSEPKVDVCFAFHTAPYGHAIAFVNTQPYGATMSTKPTLTKDAWIAAGFRALTDQGAQALRAEALARALKTTKGSFYWHFTDVAAFKAEMLAHWEQKVATEIMDQIGQEDDPLQRLRLLAEAAGAPAPEAYGGHKVEHAVRAWGLSDPNVARAIATVDKVRLDFLAHLFAEIGHSDPAIARAVYAAHIGLDDLAAKHGTDKSPAFAALISLLISKSAT